MAIRITGMYSGLDTESIISELVSAQSVKKSKYVKDQTKLSWKMDAWKALNTKIYSFYTNTLDNMRFQASFMGKVAKVSSDAFSVKASKNAVNGTQSVKVDQLATTGKVTGRNLNEDFAGKNITSSSKLSDLGINGDASFDVTVGGKKTTIKVNGDMKISDVVKKLQNAGLNASFDDENHRFFISSKESGQAADFSITANNTNGLDALEALGLLTELSKNEDNPIRKEYQKWADYLNDPDAYQAVKDKEVAKRAAEYKKANDALEKKNAELQKEINELLEKDDYKNAEGKTAEELYEELYGPMEDVLDDEGNPVKDDDGNTVQERQGGLQGALNAAKADLQKAQDAKAQRLAEAEEKGEELSEEELAKLDDDISNASQAVSDARSALNEKKAQYSAVKTVEDKQAQIDANQDSIDENRKYYNTETVTDEDGNETVKVTGSDTLIADVKAEFDAKVALADSIINGDGFGSDRKYGTRIDGVDAIITVDGATFRSSTNDFNINGMEITVYETTEKAVTVTTSDDVDGIYDMIKNFFTEYNKLINEMSALYNADSSKGYEPLTSEEKDAMSDSEIEEWEKKIKDSLLRRDGTLGDITDAMKTVMMQGAKVNGKTMYLSDFGINTLGYFNAGDNEKGAYHINGDSDDANVKGEDDILRAMIASDPDTVMSFFTGLSNNLYNTLSDKMRAIGNTSSAFTVYNDKLMQKEYDNYKDRIAKEEDKLNALMDKWYEKFARMETALAKLQGKSGGLSNMLGGQ
ncbi:MAG: flagellar filament capping protein FliD [Lachnospiraceae bacterium]|nr:flagellar filament capping protein FliD [Lachnospiraceae bacterium]